MSDKLQISEAVQSFQEERKDALAAYAEDEVFISSSRAWTLEAMEKRYVYNFDWLGRPIIQYPQDMVAVQEIVWRTRPDVIIETGIAHGGSMALSASLLALLDHADAIEDGKPLDPRSPKRRVIGVDVDIRAHNRAALESHPLFSYMTLIEGSSLDQSVVSTVVEEAKDASRVMVCLDSHHTHQHVTRELDLYAPMVTSGCYCIVFDTFIENAPTGFIKNRPWDKGDNPGTAVEAWVKLAEDFEQDKVLETKLMVTGNPGGYLVRR